MIRTDLEVRQQYRLQHVVCVYGDGQQAFATLHDVDLPYGGGQPRLRAAQPLTTPFLHSLQEQLGVRQPIEVLPESVLARTADVIAWLAPAGHRPMFFETDRPDIAIHSGERFPHPPLVFKVVNRTLYVRALAQATRPTATTKLYVAPYYNVSAEGVVCIGSMPVPDAATVNDIDGWVRAFFQSAFSHPAGAVKLTRYKGGYPALVGALAGRTEAFPARVLVDAKQTLGEFLRAHEDE